DWLGLGAGAHSHLFDERFADVANPRRYIELVKDAGSVKTKTGHIPHPNPLPSEGRGNFQEPRTHSSEIASSATETSQRQKSCVPDMVQITFREAADREREMAETVILALRLREGLDVAAFTSRFGVGVAEAFPEAWAETQGLGLTEVVDGRLRLREEAVLVG